MALQLFRTPDNDTVYAAAGYEDGTVAVWDAGQPDSPIMSSRMHTEPVMALAIDPMGKCALLHHQCKAMDHEL